MRRINIEEELEQEGFHPCLNCGLLDFEMSWETGLYSCLNCGDDVESPPMKKKKVRLVVKKLPKDDWE